MRHSNQFQLAILLLLLLIFAVATTLLFIYNYVEIGIISSLISLLLIYNIVKQYNKLSRKITLMFDAIDNNDNSLRFLNTSKSTRSDYLLNNSLNRIKDTLLNAKLEAQEREKYYEAILNQVNTGIIVINKMGIVFRINNKALNLLHISQLTHLNQLSIISEKIVNTMYDLESGKSSLIKFYNESNEVQLNISATDVILQDKELKIIAITDINTNVNNIEIDSWSRISRVLTHEIMNSLAPITSLSKTLIESDDPKFIKQGLEIIASTAADLKTFVENYRTLTRIPNPRFEEMDFAKVIKDEVKLLSKAIEIADETGGNSFVLADKGQISQIVVNLLKNAIEAVGDDLSGRVWVNIGRDKQGALYADFCNNGEEISEEIRENIFVPFFTTKERGNGIGLSLSRQIMRLHEGSISLSTKPHTTFRVKF